MRYSLTVPANYSTDISWRDGELLKWARKYVEQKGTTISAIVQAHFKRLRAKDARKVSPK